MGLGFLTDLSFITKESRDCAEGIRAVHKWVSSMPSHMLVKKLKQQKVSVITRQQKDRQLD